MAWNQFSVSVLGSLLAAVLLAVVAWSRGWIWSAGNALRRSLTLHRRLAAAGFSNFYASRDDFAKYRVAPRLIDYLSLASHSIDIVAYWMAYATEMEGVAKGIIGLVKPPKSLQIRVAIISPVGPHIEALATYLDMDEAEVIVRLQSALMRLHHAAAELTVTERRRFSLRVYTTIPIASMIILDGNERTGRIQIDIKPYKTPRHFSFAFELAGPGHYLYDLCLRAWTKLIDESQEFDPQKHLVRSPREDGRTGD